MLWGEQAVTKADLHRLIDDLPESEQETAYQILKCLKDEKRSGMARALAQELEDPLLCALADAPIDDEPETPDEAEAVREGEEDIRAGRLVSHEEARRRLLGPP